MRRTLFTLFLMLLLLTACSQNKYNDGTVIIKGVEVSVEVANEAEEWQTGMMERTKLGENQGMLFIFPDEVPRSFWMKNTLVPLDIIFISSDNQIVAVHEADPCEADPCKTYNSLMSAQYVLEVNKGFSKEHKIKEYEQVVIKIH